MMWMMGLAVALQMAQPIGPNPEYHRSAAADGSGIWHLREGQGAAAGSTATQRPAQRIVVRFADPPIFKPDTERACYLRARVIAVENGERIRTGDLVQLRSGCASANQGIFERLFPAAHLRAGATARLHVDVNAELQRVELPFPAP